MVTNILFAIFTLTSIFAGIKFGYFDSHTPPLPFVISSFLVIIGSFLIFLRKKLFKNKTNFRIHLIITIVNLIIVLYCFSPIFS